MKEKRTTNYHWFKELKGLAAPVDHGLFSEPIIVNEKFEIIEGVARFRKWKELGMPIRYIQLGGLDRSDAAVYVKISDSPPFL